jgi:hypothetical protein
MKYIKINYQIETAYQKVEVIGKVFYEGMTLIFDKKNGTFLSFIKNKWTDSKAMKFVIEDISDSEFQDAYNRMMKQLTYI